MQLLVSVSSADEVLPALAGGADIIDAKDPARGSLGPVSPAALAEILEKIPEHQPFSAALGDFTSIDAVAAAFAELTLPPRSGPTFLKLGFAGTQGGETVLALLSAAVRLAERRRAPLHIVAVAYADFARAKAVPPDVISQAARQAQAAGVLVDTQIKDGTTLLDWLGPAELAAWILHTRNLGLLTAVAGALGPADLPSISLGQPDIVGFRGAACDGGRAGRVSTERVARLRDGLTSRSIRPVIPPRPARGVAKRGMAGR